MSGWTSSKVYQPGQLKIELYLDQLSFLVIWKLSVKNVANKQVHTVYFIQFNSKVWCVFLSGTVRHQSAAVQLLERCITPTHSTPLRPPIRRLRWRKRPRRYETCNGNFTHTYCWHMVGNFCKTHPKLCVWELNYLMNAFFRLLLFFRYGMLYILGLRWRTHPSSANSFCWPLRCV